MRGKGGDTWTRLHSDVLLDWGDGDPPADEQVIPLVKKELDSLYERFAAVPTILSGIK
jgi:hypothetical protein